MPKCTVYRPLRYLQSRFASFGLCFCTEDARPRLLSALSTSFRDISSQVQDGVPFGLVPADEGDVLAPSVLANLYLPTLSLLLTVRCDWLRGGVLLVAVPLLIIQHFTESMVAVPSVLGRPVSLPDAPCRCNKMSSTKR